MQRVQFITLLNF